MGGELGEKNWKGGVDYDRILFQFLNFLWIFFLFALPYFGLIILCYFTYLFLFLTTVNILGGCVYSKERKEEGV